MRVPKVVGPGVLCVRPTTRLVGIILRPSFDSRVEVQFANARPCRHLASSDNPRTSARSGVVGHFERQLTRHSRTNQSRHRARRRLEFELVELAIEEDL